MGEPRSKSAILSFIRSRVDHPMKTKELAQALDISAADYPQFRRTVKGLVEDGELVRLKRGRIGLADQMGIIVGQISVARSGTGFLIQEGDQEDILIPSHDLLTALDGDKVMVRLKGLIQGRQAGAVIKVVERSGRNIVGLFHTAQHFSYVVPDNPRVHRDIYIADGLSRGAGEGERVVVKLVEWDDPYRNPEGEVVDRLGLPTDPGVDMLTVIKSFNLPEEFPSEVLTEAKKAAAKVENLDLTRRLDLTRQCIYTIDPEDAKDHDDAISVEKTRSGYNLGVHIADVSHYVEPGTALDSEAFQRGNSVYLPGQVIPMLPEVLSNDVCSLKPNHRRHAHSIFMEFDRKGQLVKWTLADTVIKSRAKLSYEEVQSFFDGRQLSASVKRVAESLKLARELAILLNKNRVARGSLDFDLPEAKIILNQKGEVLELGNRVRLESHRLVEEFMLAANRAVAKEVLNLAQPFLYRVHDKPDLDKLEAFSAMMERLGYRFPVSKTMKPALFARFLEKTKNVPEADFINELMLRSMKKAVYQRENIGHFGLAFEHYTHFTSPIRRYPDMLVHRLLRKLKRGRYSVAFARRINDVIDNVGRHCSETERVAEAAERQAIKVKQVAFMAAHIGEQYQGVISGVMPHGFFVRLDNMGVEGMVRVSSIDDDYYRYEEKNYRIIGRRKKRAFRLGDAVSVGVLKVDTVRSEIDLFLPDKDKGRQPKKAPAAGHGRRVKRGRK